MSHGQDQESNVGDGEDAVILTARRVRIVRCCRATQTTLSSVRFQFAMSRTTQLTVIRASSRREGQKNEWSSSGNTGFRRDRQRR